MKEKNRKAFYFSIILLGVILYILSKKLNQQKIWIDTNLDKEISCSNILLNESYIEQGIYVDHDMRLVLQLCMVTWESKFERDDFIRISVIKRDSKDVVCTKEFEAKSFADHKLSRYLVFEEALLEKDNWYNIRIESNITDKEKPIAVACVEHKLPQVTGVVLDGRKMEYNLRMRISE